MSLTLRELLARACRLERGGGQPAVADESDSNVQGTSPALIGVFIVQIEFQVSSSTDEGILVLPVPGE